MTNDLLTATPSSHLHNGGFEHGPLQFHVPHLPQDAWKIFPEVGVEDLQKGAQRQPPWAIPEKERVQPLSRRLVPEPVLCVEVRPTISSWYHSIPTSAPVPSPPER